MVFLLQSLGSIISFISIKLAVIIHLYSASPYGILVHDWVLQTMTVQEDAASCFKIH